MYYRSLSNLTDGRGLKDANEVKLTITKIVALTLMFCSMSVHGKRNSMDGVGEKRVDLRHDGGS